MGLFERIFNALNSHIGNDVKVAVKHIEEEFDFIRDDFKKEIARLETMITTGKGTAENPTLAATASTESVLSKDEEIAKQNAAAAKATV